jgi:hypothetical protein
VDLEICVGDYVVEGCRFMDPKKWPVISTYRMPPHHVLLLEDGTRRPGHAALRCCVEIVANANPLIYLLPAMVGTDEKDANFFVEKSPKETQNTMNAVEQSSIPAQNEKFAGQEVPGTQSSDDENFTR